MNVDHFLSKCPTSMILCRINRTAAFSIYKLKIYYTRIDIQVTKKKTHQLCHIKRFIHKLQDAKRVFLVVASEHKRSRKRITDNDTEWQTYGKTIYHGSSINEPYFH